MATGAEKASNAHDKLIRKLDKEKDTRNEVLETNTSTEGSGEGTGTIRVWKSPTFNNHFYKRGA